MDACAHIEELGVLGAADLFFVALHVTIESRICLPGGMKCHLSSLLAIRVRKASREGDLVALCCVCSECARLTVGSRRDFDDCLDPGDLVSGGVAL